MCEWRITLLMNELIFLWMNELINPFVFVNGKVLPHGFQNVLSIDIGLV